MFYYSPEASAPELSRLIGAMSPPIDSADAILAVRSHVLVEEGFWCSVAYERSIIVTNTLLQKVIPIGSDKVPNRQRHYRLETRNAC